MEFINILVVFVNRELSLLLLHHRISAAGNPQRTDAARGCHDRPGNDYDDKLGLYPSTTVLSVPATNATSCVRRF